ncbi:MAG: DUF192 domain-containing protein, partial [Actinomycetota bacterium]
LTSLLLSACGGSGPPVEGLPSGSLALDTGGAEVVVDVAIAETTESQQKGLMGVEEMAESSGMVFLEEEPVSQPFWMKDTLIPLSVAFWDEEGEILAILDVDPCRADPCTIYDPNVTWIGALEVNQGFFAGRGIEVGDRVSLQR